MVIYNRIFAFAILESCVGAGGVAVLSWFVTRVIKKSRCERAQRVWQSPGKEQLLFVGIATLVNKKR
jgi:hypothetical protein